MKLRIKGDSLRLRVGPTEIARLLETGRVEETIHFGPDDDAHLTYVLEHGDVDALTARYGKARLAVTASTEVVRAWVDGAEVGMYGSIPLTAGRLEIAVEKDWACLDENDAANADTFPNPKQC